MSNVKLIDPLDVNINTTIVNGIPKYEDMFIFAELYGVRKGRSVLVTTEGSAKYGIQATGLESTTRVNFMGINQTEGDENNKNPNFLNFTTNYYDGSNGNNIQYEGFGMSGIKVVLNSSFVPQINIQFVDIRGLAFFNRANSPYRILFDFPPPIFYLTLKGYYGKSLSYQLHLVKYTTEFKAENGNFIIDAQFVAVTFAPLTDVLLRYVINFPLMPPAQISLNPDAHTAPTNTYELIMKLKNLYTAISDDIKNSTETKEYDAVIVKIANNNNAITVLDSFNSQLSNAQSQPYMLIKDVAPAQQQTVPSTSQQIASLPYYNFKGNQPTADNAKAIITPISTLLGYDSAIQFNAVSGVQANTNKRLFISYIVGQNISPALPTTNAALINELGSQLLAFKASLIQKASDNGISVLTTDISDPQVFDNNYNIANNAASTSSTTKYVGIDVTDYYNKLYKNKADLTKQKVTLSKSINTKINQKILDNLGLRPSIYNIFKIILDDVDKFFKKIKDTSDEAENRHHNIDDYKRLIINDGSYKDTGSGSDGITVSNNKIFAFPLIIKNQQPVAGGYRQVRIAPIELSRKLPRPFPEISLVEDFIDSFNSQQNYTELSNMRANQNENGVNKWIPISPVDSTLGTTDLQSPYIGVDTSTGGGVNGQPINISSDNRIDQVLKIVLNRFYILTQSSLPTNFYKGGKISAAYANLYAEAEAYNLTASIFDSKYGQNLRQFAQDHNTADAFYKYLSENTALNGDFYDFPEINPSTGTPTKESIPITTSDNVYVDKEFTQYKGMVLSPSKTINIRTPQQGSEDPIDKFQETTRRGFFKNNFNAIPQSSFQFTTENVPYIEDTMEADATLKLLDVQTKYNGTSLITRFVTPEVIKVFNADDVLNAKVTINSSGRNLNRINTIDQLAVTGNSYFLSNNGFNGSIASNASRLSSSSFASVPTVWIDVLSKHDNEIYADIINQSTPLGAIILLSNFGYTASPFNKYPKNLNGLLFNIPAAIEVPSYLPAYMGSLIDAKTNGIATQLKNFFTNGSGKNLESSGLFIFADIGDIENVLSANDKAEFKSAFNTFNDQYLKIRSALQSTYTQVQDKVGTRGQYNSDDAYIKAKAAAYKSLLYPNNDDNTGESFANVLLPMLTGSKIINFSEITFTKPVTEQKGYKSIKSLNDASSSNKTINDIYFKKFFTSLLSQIDAKATDLKQADTDNEKRKGDEDIVTQTYYSFKNINDKWLCNPNVKNVQGYPFNPSGKNLIDIFAFVDRAMNPIGDTIINAEALVQMFDDPNISVFTALSQLLSLNGFEFFPLQNLMSYNDQAWEESFKIDVNGTPTNSAAFVCMFVGGTSSYPTGMDNDFKDDGITDISNETNMPSDFQTKKPDTGTASPEDQSQETNYGGFPWRQVRAFRVRFGEQNQSMFTDIKIDSKEYPETNESIQILARLAGDAKGTTPIPKGQNLYNLYENRAYRATINGMGNVMIQPTQYFQLENVPLFNGAYIILSVEHTIEPNRMMTSFSGTKILRYPVPRVMNPATLIGFDGGDSEETNVSMLSAGDISRGVGSESAADKARYNSMYKGFEIQ